MSVATLRWPQVQADRADIAASLAPAGSTNSRRARLPRSRPVRNASWGTLQRTRRRAEEHVGWITLGIFGQVAQVVRNPPQILDRRREIALAATEDAVKARQRSVHVCNRRGELRIGNQLAYLLDRGVGGFRQLL